MSKRTFNLVTGIVGGVEAISIAIVTFVGPEFAAAINASIGVVGTAVIEVCSKFITSDNK